MLNITQEEITQHWPQAWETPMASIRCITYNQESYIAQALEGFLAQKTDFPFEIVVHDDASTDKTAEIIRKYERKYPKIIKPIYESENQHSKRNGSLRRIVDGACHGKYIAFCEGDDYWTDPQKLSKQVHFLEATPDYGMCYGLAKQYVQSKRSFSAIRGKDYVSFDYMLTHTNCIPTLTACIRSDLLFRFRNEFQSRSPNWAMGDLPMWLWFAQQAKIKFFPEIFGVYRILKTSAAHSMDIEKQIAFYKAGHDCANYFSIKFRNKELAPFDEHIEKARLFSTRIHDRKKALAEYKSITNKKTKHKILIILHSNCFTFALLRVYYSFKHKQ